VSHHYKEGLLALVRGTELGTVLWITNLLVWLWISTPLYPLQTPPPDRMMPPLPRGEVESFSLEGVRSDGMIMAGRDLYFGAGPGMVFMGLNLPASFVAGVLTIPIALLSLPLSAYARSFVIAPFWFCTTWLQWQAVALCVKARFRRVTA
jgi:hypothetical protein